MSARASSLSPYPTVLPPSLKAERIQLWLQQMPGWELLSGGVQILRHFHFRTRADSLTFLRHAMSVIESMEVPFGLRGPTLAYRGDRVTVSIWSYRGSFIGPDLEVARLVSQPSC
ncbi:MAG TPA: hypothetical protein VGS22_19500 [Thermoanaerobaculia bacterium]|nr:hypothetical protein [Thermoanaerobaculia bacterium]